MRSKVIIIIFLISLAVVLSYDFLENKTTASYCEASIIGAQARISYDTLLESTVTIIISLITTVGGIIYWIVNRLDKIEKNYLLINSIITTHEQYINNLTNLSSDLNSSLKDIDSNINEIRSNIIRDSTKLEYLELTIKSINEILRSYKQ